MRYCKIRPFWWLFAIVLISSSKTLGETTPPIIHSTILSSVSLVDNLTTTIPEVSSTTVQNDFSTSFSPSTTKNFTENLSVPTTQKTDFIQTTTESNFSIYIQERHSTNKNDFSSSTRKIVANSNYEKENENQHTTKQTFDKSSETRNVKSQTTTEANDDQHQKQTTETVPTRQVSQHTISAITNNHTIITPTPRDAYNELTTLIHSKLDNELNTTTAKQPTIQRTTERGSENQHETSRDENGEINSNGTEKDSSNVENEPVTESNAQDITSSEKSNSRSNSQHATSTSENFDFENVSVTTENGSNVQHTTSSGSNKENRSNTKDVKSTLGNLDFEKESHHTTKKWPNNVQHTTTTWSTISKDVDDNSGDTSETRTTKDSENRNINSTDYHNISYITESENQLPTTSNPEGKKESNFHHTTTSSNPDKENETLEEGSKFQYSTKTATESNIIELVSDSESTDFQYTTSISHTQDVAKTTRESSKIQHDTTSSNLDQTRLDTDTTKRDDKKNAMTSSVITLVTKKNAKHQDDDIAVSNNYDVTTRRSWNWNKWKLSTRRAKRKWSWNTKTTTKNPHSYFSNFEKDKKSFEKDKSFPSFGNWSLKENNETKPCMQLTGSLSFVPSNAKLAEIHVPSNATTFGKCGDWMEIHWQSILSQDYSKSFYFLKFQLAKNLSNVYIKNVELALQQFFPNSRSGGSFRFATKKQSFACDFKPRRCIFRDNEQQLEMQIVGDFKLEVYSDNKNPNLIKLEATPLENNINSNVLTYIPFLMLAALSTMFGIANFVITKYKKRSAYIRLE